MEYAFQFSQVLAGIGRKRLITKYLFMDSNLNK